MSRLWPLAKRLEPVGSLKTGIPAEDNDRKIMPFTTLCLTILLGPTYRPYCPWTSTVASHLQVWAKQMLQPRRRKTATRTASLLSFIPQCQKPVPTRKVAICTGSEMENSTTAWDARIPGLSQKDCLRGSGSDAGSEPEDRLPSGEVSIKVNIWWPTESETGDQRCSQPKPSRRVMQANAPVLSPDTHP